MSKAEEKEGKDEQSVVAKSHGQVCKQRAPTSLCTDTPVQTSYSLLRDG